MAILAAGVTVPSAAAETCIASVYWEGFGRPLADGRRHGASEVLAAHKSLPFGTVVRVTNLANGRAADIPVRDRGPYVLGRCIDLTRAAAARLGISGIARVTVEPIVSTSPKALGDGVSKANDRKRP